MNLTQILGWIRGLPKKPGAPFLLGINGPQGSGKSTLSAAIKDALARDGIQAVAVSIDDFYLTREQQIALARQFPQNPYLHQRGYPGTHDIPLGSRVLSTLKKLTVGSAPAQVPRYDKSAHEGKGDRLPESSWSSVSPPLDFIIFEGWMLGFTPVSDNILPNANFHPVNQYLARYKAWHALLDGFLQLKPDDYRHVLHWRVEAEEKMKAAGKPGMTTEEITKYINLFLPAYETYLPQLAAYPPVDKNILTVKIGKERLALT